MSSDIVAVVGGPSRSARYGRLADASLVASARRLRQRALKLSRYAGGPRNVERRAGALGCGVGNKSGAWSAGNWLHRRDLAPAIASALAGGFKLPCFLLAAWRRPGRRGRDPPHLKSRRERSASPSSTPKLGELIRAPRAAPPVALGPASWHPCHDDDTYHIHAEGHGLETVAGDQCPHLRHVAFRRVGAAHGSIGRTPDLAGSRPGRVRLLDAVMPEGGARCHPSLTAGSAGTSVRGGRAAGVGATLAIGPPAGGGDAVVGQPPAATLPGLRVAQRATPTVPHRRLRGVIWRRDDRLPAVPRAIPRISGSRLERTTGVTDTSGEALDASAAGRGILGIGSSRGGLRSRVIKVPGDTKFVSKE